MVHASSTPIKLDVYRPRKPQNSAYYRCAEDCFETFEQVYQERFEQKYGFSRPYVGQVMLRYLDCGILKSGKRKKTDADDKIPCILEPELTDKAFRRNWARLIQKIYEVDPLLCPRCFSEMRIISVIEDPDVMEKILKHLGLWDVKRKPRPVANAPPIDVFPAYDEQPGPSADDYTSDPDYPAEAYF